MRHRAVLLILALVAVVAALALAACGSSSTSSGSSASASAAPQTSASPSASAAAGGTTIVPMSDLPDVVHARVGDTITVTLHSNASTGYQWVAQDLNTAAVLKQKGQPVQVAPKKKLAGAPGHTKFTFQVMKDGVDEIGFWYQPPGGGSAGATWALVVNAKKGHIPVNVDAGEDYTAEAAQMRTGDTLVVSIGHAANAGRHAWRVIAGTSNLKLVGQKYSNGTQTATFSGTAAGSTTLVMVNRPTGDPPLQTYALPVILKQPKAPVTYQFNKLDNGETHLAKVGDTLQVALNDQPSTDFQWKFQKLNKRILKQVGKPQFFPNSSAIGARGKMVWTFAVVGAGKTPLIANYQQVPADVMPIKSWQIQLVVKPGFTPKIVQASTTYPADTVHVLPGDQIKLKLSANAGVWSKPASTKQLKVAKPVKQGNLTVIAFTAKNHGIVTPVTVANASGSFPNQAYAFSATVGKGKLPIAIDAAERHAVKPIQVQAGQAFDIALESNSGSTGYTWAVANISPDGVIQQDGDPTIQPPDTEMPGASGATIMHFKALAAGDAQLVLFYNPPGEGGVPGAVYMTMVTVQ